MDSGPLLLSYSIPATTFAGADAVALGDWPNAARLRRMVRLGSREVCTRQEPCYEVRLFSLNVNPLAKALPWADMPGPLAPAPPSGAVLR